MPGALWREAVELARTLGISEGLEGIDDPTTVRDLDPLDADDFFGNLPSLNSAGATEPLIAWLRQVVAHPGLEEFDKHATHAAMRDVGMVLGSLQRRGVHAAHVDTRLPRLLKEWGDLVGMVPRDTVVHYGPWNPPGERERRYTSDPQEQILIESVRQAADLLPAMALHVCIAQHHGIGSQEGIRALRSGVGHFRRYVENFEHVRDHVSPAFFARELRPFFEPVDVDGAWYHGPAAAFLPMYLVDTLLWGDAGPEHRTMMSEAALYGIPAWRSLLGMCQRGEPLSHIYERAIRDGAEAGAATMEGGLIDELLALLVRFRGQHVTVARHAYDAAITEFATGSGGYSPEILVAITRATRDADHRVRDLTDRARPVEGASG